MLVKLNNYKKTTTVNYKLLLVLMFFTSVIKSQSNLTQYVNPFIGTGGHGHTFPGAVLPFGMVQLSPDTRVDGSWDGCSGYHHSDTLIYGFSHTHLSGTGCTDWGDILLMPTGGQTNINNKLYASKFSHKDEMATPGYYEVTLKPRNIKVELTVTPRVGIHRYTFPKESAQQVILDLLHRDKTLSCNILVKDNNTIVGSRVSEAWAKEQHIYFAIRFSKPFSSSTQFANGKPLSKENPYTGKMEGGIFTFNNSDGKPLLVKVAISAVSTEGAMHNLMAEATHWDFEQYKKEAEETWNKQLHKVEIENGDRDKMAVFYSALYHCFIHPSLNMDVDNQYRGRDNKIHYASGFTNYSVFSLWDTYRALHPLFTLVEQKRSADFINSFLNQYKQSGRLPVWELSSNETDCMIGFHSVSVIADAMVKGIGGFDSLTAYQAMKAASNYSGFGIPQFNRMGYLQVEDQGESVSRSLEYGYDNWCIAQVAAMLGQKKDEKVFLKRSLSYQNLFDASTGNMRPRRNGGWLNPFYANDINNHFTEGNSWQYSFYVPHDVEGLIKLHGGPKKFETKLDELFETSEKTRGREQADVTGLIGQYAHGNEPSHHMAYLYNYVGKPQKTIQRVRQICDNFYKNTVDGLIGNEDCGQMSAWYVLSAMGMYPVCPGSTQFILSEPAFANINLNLENGKRFSVRANPALNKPVTAITLNGKRQQTSYVDFTSIQSGSELAFLNEDLQGKTNTYGELKGDLPSSSVTKVSIIPAPIIKSTNQVFRDSLWVSVEIINTPVNLVSMYSLDGSLPIGNDAMYRKPFLIDSSCTMKSIVYSNEDKSVISTAKFYKLKHNYNISIKSKLHEQYLAEGVQTLEDGVMGDSDWKKGNWLGCQGQDFECRADLKKPTEINSLALECLQDTRAWIVFPKSVSFYGSNDNVNFTLLETVTNTIQAKDETCQLKLFKTTLKKPAKYRYIKVLAKSFGKLPAWHLGVGGDSYIFVDELEIK